MTVTQIEKLLKLLQKSEELFDGTFGTQKIDPVDSKLEKKHKDNILATISSTKGT